MTTSSVYVLLKDKVQAEKATRVLGVPVPRAIHTSHCQVLKGELVTPIPEADIIPRSDGQNAHNYRTLTRDSPATFYDDDSEDDLAPLKPNEYDVLASVKSPAARYSIFLKPGKLDWGCSLKVGDKVSVEVPIIATAAGHKIRASAVVRYVGPVTALPGITFGVEIKDKAYFGYGTTDGLFQDDQYFRCSPDCGLFVSLEKLSRYPPVDAYSQAPPSDPHHSQQPQSGQRHSQQPQSTPQGRGSAVGSSTDLQTYRYKIGDRVVVFTTKGDGVHGTVKWVGIHSFTVDKKEHAIKTVGVETDVKVKRSEVDSLPQKGHLVVPAKDKSAVFFSEDEVISEATFAERPRDSPPVADRPVNTETKKLLSEAVSEGYHSPQQPPAGDDTTSLAKAVGVTHTELLQENRQVLQEMEQRKQEEELEKLRQAVPDQSLNVARQEHMLQEISAERNHEAERREGGGGGGRDGDQHNPQKPEPVYDMVGPSCQGVTLPTSQPQQHNQLHGQPPHSQPQPHHGHQQHSQPPPHSPSRYQQQGYYQWHQAAGQYPPDQNIAQLGWHQQNLPQSEHQQQNYHNIPGSVGIPSTTAAPAGLPHGGPPPVSQPHSTPQPGQPGQGHNIAYDGRQRFAIPSGLEVGSAVQLVNNDSRTGVIRWIGTFPGMQGVIAGLELDEPMEGCNDGEWGGHHYFKCQYGRALFCPLANLRPVSHGNPLNVPDWEDQDQAVVGNLFKQYIGDWKGIQGHLNSCYLDATIFGLFALNDVFDSLFLDNANLSLTRVHSPEPLTPAQYIQREIGGMLWKGIVNPLRKNGAVRFESVMKLRNKLDELGKMEGVSSKEKDPEEFLNMLFKYTLHVEPFIQIKRPFGTEPEFFIQLFVEFDESLKVPTIERLLQKMFREQQISFTGGVPSKLLVQVPRYGKQFQTYKRIVPGIKLDADPLMEFPQICFICGETAQYTCKECKNYCKEESESVQFCDRCIGLMHQHKSRVSHKPEALVTAGELELLSVLCIETSHYVCFTREPGEDRWLFFDSMADRIYDQYNIPRGVDCTAELNDWVYRGDPERLMTAGHRELPELVRRFTQDVYMCVYIQPDSGMYG